VTGGTDLEIHGRVDGDVVVGGELLIESHGLVTANLSARRAVVRGAVKGDIVAEEAVHLEDGARVVGDVRAPKVAITTGALVRGYVQTAGASGSARKQAPPARAAAPAPKATTAARSPAPPPAPARAPAPPMPRAATLAGAAPARKGPPPLVVPAIKKGAKAIQKKKG
jgi:cytoskeletal protein CcmA (bactofilin family)